MRRIPESDGVSSAARRFTFLTCREDRRDSAELRTTRADSREDLAARGEDCNGGIMSFLPRHCFAASNSVLPSSRYGIPRLRIAARRRAKNVELPV